MWLARRLALVYDSPVIRSSKRAFGAGALALLIVLILAAPTAAAPMDSANEPQVVEAAGVRAGDCAELGGEEYCKREFEVALAYSVICPDEPGVALSVTFRVGSDLTLEPLETITRKLKEPCKGTWESTSTTEGTFYVATFEGFPPIGKGDGSPASIWISPLGSPTPGDHPAVYEYPFVYEVKEPDGAVIAQAPYTAEVLPERRVEEGETGYQSECVEGGSVRYTPEGKGYCTLASEVRYRKGWPAPPVTPVNTAPPVLSGTAAVEERLTCTHGSWANKPTNVAYRWLRDGVPIAEKSSNTYYVGYEDEGYTLTCEVIASNAAGSATATSNGLAIPPPPPEKKRQEEEAKEAVAIGSVSLDGSAINVQSNHEALIKLTCTGTATCSGKLTLTVKRTTRKGKKKHTKTQTIGTATFSIPAGKSETIRLMLSGTGRSILSAARGHLSADLTTLKASPSPSKTRTQGVHLAQRKTKSSKK